MSKKAWIGLAAGLLALCLVVAAVFWFQSRKETPVPEEPPVVEETLEPYMTQPPEEEQGEEEAVPFGNFDVQVLNGAEDERLTQEYFAKAKFTIINFWGTYCPPCIAEMPHLGEINERTNGEVQVVGILIDAMTQDGSIDEGVIEAMHTIMDDAKAEFPVVNYDDASIIAWLSYISVVPTTIVVDHEGIVVDAFEGSLSLNQWMALCEGLLAQ